MPLPPPPPPLSFPPPPPSHGLSEGSVSRPSTARPECVTSCIIPGGSQGDPGPSAAQCSEPASHPHCGAPACSAVPAGLMSFSSSSSSSSELHSHLKTAGAGAVQSLFPLLLQYGPLAGQGAQPAPPRIRLLSFFGCPCACCPGTARSHGTYALGEGRWLGQRVAGMGGEFCRGFSRMALDVCQDGCQPAPGNG